MLKIAICDDDVQALSSISNLLNHYKTEKNVAFMYDAFTNAIELLEAMKRQGYDILFLDVLMPGMNGLTAAHEIRSFDPAIKIIFLTSSREFAVESYAVNAHYYMLKPSTQFELFPILDRIILEKNKTEETLSIMQPSGFMCISLAKIEFLEVQGKKLMFHFDDRIVKEIRGSLSDYEDQMLCKENFIKVHRAFIVNMEYIQALNPQELITYTGQRVPISRLLYKEVKEKYMQFLFVEKGVK